MILAETQTAAAILDAFIDAELGRRGLAEDSLALVGFSQGTMMALHVAPRRARPAAAVVGYSGMLIAPQLLAAEIKSRPPMLLVHGTADPVVPMPAGDSESGHRGGRHRRHRGDAPGPGARDRRGGIGARRRLHRGRFRACKAMTVAGRFDAKSLTN